MWKVSLVNLVVDEILDCILCIIRARSDHKPSVTSLRNNNPPKVLLHQRGSGCAWPEREFNTEDRVSTINREQVVVCVCVIATWFPLGYYSPLDYLPVCCPRRRTPTRSREPLGWYCRREMINCAKFPSISLMILCQSDSNRWWPVVPVPLTQFIYPSTDHDDHRMMIV